MKAYNETADEYMYLSDKNHFKPNLQLHLNSEPWNVKQFKIILYANDQCHLYVNVIQIECIHFLSYS